MLLNLIHMLASVNKFDKYYRVNLCVLIFLFDLLLSDNSMSNFSNNLKWIGLTKLDIKSSLSNKSNRNININKLTLNKIRYRIKNLSNLLTKTYKYVRFKSISSSLKNYLMQFGLCFSVNKHIYLFFKKKH